MITHNFFNVKVILTVSLLTQYLVSCADLNRSKQITTISNLNSTVDSIKIVLKENEIIPIHNISMEYAQLEEQIRQHITGNDTIEVQFAKKLDQLKHIKFSFKPLEYHYTELKSFVISEKKSLNQLKKDISESNGERENYDKNILLESKKIELAKKLINEYSLKREKALTIFNQYKDELKNFADTL